jgi:2-C-methyl-D-erythritol 4-phosphate cytidylyltransferase
MTRRVSIVIPAGGLGLRMGAGEPKQLQVHLGKTMLEWSLDPFLALGSRLGKVVIPLAKEIHQQRPTFMDRWPSTVHTCVGGVTRQESVHRGFQVLLDLGASEDLWLVHDAARPMLSQEDLLRLIDKIEESSDGALLATPVRDTLKRSNGDAQVEGTVDRACLWQAQTPQGAPGPLLWDASCRGLKEQWEVTDDASLLEQSGVPVHLVQSQNVNFKVTLPEDWDGFTAMKKN